MERVEWRIYFHVNAETISDFSIPEQQPEGFVLIAKGSV
jgi:hypothetical protein